MFDPVVDGLQHKPFAKVVEPKGITYAYGKGRAFCWTVSADTKKTPHGGLGYRLQCEGEIHSYWYCAKCVEDHLIRAGLIW